MTKLAGDVTVKAKLGSAMDPSLRPSVGLRGGHLRSQAVQRSVQLTTPELELQEEKFQEI